MPTDVENWKSEVYGNEVRDRLFEFAEEGYDSIPDDERDAWFERFKWWGLYHQRNGQEGYFMLRIGTPNGVLEPGQLRVVGEIADEYARGPGTNPVFGDAYADFTTRQSIQLHWIELSDVPAVFEKLEANGLSTQQACGDSWRNIVGNPVAGKDGQEVIDAWPVIRDLNERFKGNDDHANLPRKWKVSVTGSADGSGQGDINDLAFEPAYKSVDGDGDASGDAVGFNVRVGGGLARNEPRFARDIDVWVPPERVPDVAGGLSALFRDHGDREDRYNARVKFLVDEWGAEEVRETLQAEYVDFELETAGRDVREEYTYNAGEGERNDLIGVHDQKDGANFVGLNVLVGRMGAADVLDLADLAAEYGSGEVRLSQRQNVIVTDVPDDALDAFLDEPLLDDYSPYPSPFMRGSVACTGTEFCSLSIVETKNRQVRFARWLKENVDLPDGVDEFHVHLSGCTASCAQPQIADVSLRGMKTRKDGEPVEALDVGLGGGLGEDPGFARWVTQRVPVDEVPGAIANLIDSFAAERDEGESFRAFVARHDEDELDALVDPEETDYEDPMMHNTKRTWYPYAENDSMDDAPSPPADD
ncbi:ferredoxin--nitrite reductase [Halorubrum ezzemoulense]|uniref:nitrite/sulfite reductase n=1 Tax=Halorubrum ezzemoulense TaxID=337243 RepID=UPI00232C1FDF|nr:ferredoxin--nitrite reductase [Halorubrum ezzemoulense]MDB9247989.1 ferredoxin--nitrite reductase [Halorubrum ezzemoulense]MDB9258102.1 ferredoxin--nitrite reductase [Halorubrum ezzemoulense]MDB9261536.1 ferredoxin--nitrite reductase [Halorubrum ezzemoulense]MDB9265039.1 ferredoxin--nitrite reductase [Halorubrum ezzemoulense]MDB9268463.1 ferredoxin--nitrite reductase [Halorubrum ezzemoulense]